MVSGFKHCVQKNLTKLISESVFPLELYVFWLRIGWPLKVIEKLISIITFKSYCFKLPPAVAGKMCWNHSDKSHRDSSLHYKEKTIILWLVQKSKIYSYKIFQMMCFTCMWEHLNPFTQCKAGLKKFSASQKQHYKKYQWNTWKSTSHNQAKITTKFSKKQELGGGGRHFPPASSSH